MSQNAKNAAAIIIAVLVCVVLLQVYTSHTGIDLYEAGQIPTIEGLQQFLKDTGMERYNPGKVDGVVGPNTVKAWENYSFDVYAGAWND